MREAILDAALALADERGLDAVSMRAVAARVGVTPMALYPYVGNKAALLDGLVGRLLAELPVPDRRLDWRDRLMRMAYAGRDLARRHPATFGLVMSRPAVTPDAVRVVDALYQALLDAGVPEPDVPRLERLVTTFVLGYVASEVNGRFAPGSLSPRGRRATLGPDELPGHHRLAKWLDQPADWDAEFDADLRDLQRLIETVAAVGEANSRTGS